ncbi:MAG: ethylbenzene dehydrogenase-related protein [Planctomycetota bacterium]|nr:ethylbenzene dehydrogenase-related protein [Planctomycetota bacterium]
MRTTGILLAFSALTIIFDTTIQGEAIDAKVDKVSEGPKLDGKADDACWKSATEYKLELLGVGDLIDRKVKATMRAVQDGKSVHFLFTWEDPEANTKHKSYEWSEDKNFYQEINDLEDQFSVAFELQGAFTANMLTPLRTQSPIYWDVWQWGAARTNNGYALDLWHIYSQKALSPKIEKQSKHRDRQGKIIWMARPNDEGTPVYSEVSMSSTDRKKKGEPVVARFQTTKPTGSAADVLAMATWADGKWTIEMSRDLTTKDAVWPRSRIPSGAPDVQFEAGESFKMALASFNHTEGNSHYASEVIRLSF